MAGVSERPDAFFRLSPAADGKLRWFAIRRGEIKNRFDAKYFALRETLASTRYPLKSLSELVREEPNYGAGSRAIVRTLLEQPRYIRITDFGEDGIEPGHEYVTADPIEPDCELTEGDLLFARSGATVGKTYLHEDVSEPAMFAGYCIRFRFRQSVALPKFIYWFTKTETYARWVATIQRPAGQPNINKEEFKTTQVPLPEIPEQTKLIAAMETARVMRRAKQAEADALLAGLDSYLLATLGLTSPPRPKTTFAVRVSDLTGVMNPDRYRGLQLEKHLPFMSNVGGVGALIDVRCTPEKEAPTELWDWIRIDDLPNQPWKVETLRTERGGNIQGTFFKVEENDILIARLGPTIQNSKFILCPKLHRQTVASSEFLVLRCNPGWHPEAVLWLLRTSLYREIMYARSRGATPSRYRLDGADLVTIPFPIIDEKVQTAIATEARRRRDEALRLRADEEAGWQAAKHWFEEQLLGPVQS